jgi:hypothetical protein
MSNPKNMMGLAHFLGIIIIFIKYYVLKEIIYLFKNFNMYKFFTKEHMLFKGSEKYPDENLFVTTVAGNGGKFNAYTGFIFIIISKTRY